MEGRQRGTGFANERDRQAHFWKGNRKVDDNQPGESAVDERQCRLARAIVSIAERIKAGRMAVQESTVLVWRLFLLFAMLSFVAAIVLLVMVGAGNPTAERVWARITVGTVKAEAESRQVRDVGKKISKDASEIRKNATGTGEAK